MSLPSLAEDGESGIYTPRFYIDTSPTFYNNCTRSIRFVAPIHAYCTSTLIQILSTVCTKTLLLSIFTP